MAIAVEPALSPHLTVDDAAAAIDFYVNAFDAAKDSLAVVLLVESFP